MYVAQDFDSRGRIENDTLKIDRTKSKILWKGTKMMGLGKHEGEIPIHEGFLMFRNNELSGGEITVDMRKITVTDIPKTDPIPIRNLTNHLKGPDFFDVEQHPFSHLEIRSIQKSNVDKLLVTGDLMIKGISNPVSFEVVTVGHNQFQASLQFDRFVWDIAYSGNWLDRTLVDREIDLKVEIVSK